MKPRTVVVGNGPGVLGSGLGDRVDSFENVVRINNYRTDGFAADVGSKLDTWAVTLYRDIHRGKVLDTKASHLLLPLNHWPIPPGWQASLNFLEEVGAKLGIPVTVPSADTINGLKEGIKNSKASSGTTVLAHYLDTEGSVAAVGFDFFANKSGHHYFGKNDKRPKGCPHKGWLERDWFFGKVDEGKIHVVESEALAPELISRYETLHSENPNYGSVNGVHPKVVEWAKGRSLTSVLDYGCGKGVLVDMLQKQGVSAVGFDPAVSRFLGNYKISGEKSYQGVCCTDVMEHIPMSSVPHTLKTIGRLAEKTVFLNISTRKAAHHFPDGRNCHETVCSGKVWREIVARHLGEFETAHDHIGHDTFTAVLARK
jgi:hypothetical protein